MLLKGVRYCDCCGIKLNRNNNKCGYELCDRCNEQLEDKVRQKSDERMNNKGITLVELIITIFLVAIVGITIWGLIRYGNKPVSEMPIWLYWLLSK